MPSGHIVCRKLNNLQKSCLSIYPDHAMETALRHTGIPCSELGGRYTPPNTHTLYVKYLICNMSERVAIYGKQWSLSAGVDHDVDEI